MWIEDLLGRSASRKKATTSEKLEINVLAYGSQSVNLQNSVKANLDLWHIAVEKYK